MVPKVRPTACITMPGKRSSNIAETAPRNRPSSTAYSGAVYIAHSFLNTVTSATTKPPIAPPQTYGITAPGLPAAIAAENCDQVNSAPARVSTSSSAVLLTVPFRLIAPASLRTRVPVPRSRKVLSFSAGLPLRIMVVGPRKRGGRRMRGAYRGADAFADGGLDAWLVRKAGLEPARLAALEPKSRASTNSATFACPHCSLR